MHIGGQRGVLVVAGCRRRRPGCSFMMVGHGGSFRRVNDTF
jgi:hypothetical protein